MEQVSLLRVESYQTNLSNSIVKLLKPLGGLQAFCQQGDRVLLKPNFIMARSVESAATTHPAIILAVATLLKDSGCQVAVGDSPGLGTAAGVVQKLGLSDDLKRLGVKVIELATPGSNDLKNNVMFERRFHNLLLAKELENFDRIINLPKLKSHGQMGLTLATKNLFGCVAGHHKAGWHFNVGKDNRVFARLLVEIALTVNASLHILDGIIGMDGNGPSSGRARELNILMAGTNPIAIDRVVVELIQQKPEHFPIFGAARELKISGIQMAEIKIQGESLQSCRINHFEIPAFGDLTLFLRNRIISDIAAKFIKQRIKLNPKLCTQCRKCETHCPAKAIHFHQKIRIDANICIKCCCCQELCPEGALSVSNPIGARLLKKLRLM